MTAPSTLGMSPARRRIYEAGYAAQRQKQHAEEARRDAEMQARRDAARVAIEAALVREDAERQAVIRAAVSRHPVSIIIDEVAARHGVSTTDMLGRNFDRVTERYRQNTAALHEAMWRARQETALSLPAIGRRFGGRDHTTVLWGVRQHQKRLDGAARAAGGEG